MFWVRLPTVEKVQALKTKIQAEMELWGSGNLNISIQDCDTVAIVRK